MSPKLSTQPRGTANQLTGRSLVAVSGGCAGSPNCLPSPTARRADAPLPGRLRTCEHGGMSDIERRRSSRPSRRTREQRAYRLVLATGTFGVIGVVGIVLA